MIDASIVTARDLSGRYDLVLVGVKAEALPDAMQDFKPAVGPDTAVLPSLNGVASPVAA